MRTRRAVALALAGTLAVLVLALVLRTAAGARDERGGLARPEPARSTRDAEPSARPGLGAAPPSALAPLEDGDARDAAPPALAAREGASGRDVLRVRVECVPYVRSPPPAEIAVTCSDADGRAWPAARVDGLAPGWCTPALPPGEYEVRVDAPGCAPWSHVGARPGDELVAELRGTAAVALDVVDGATGAPVADYGLRLRLDEAGTPRCVFRLRSAGDPPREGGRFEGLDAVATSLVVDAEGYALCDLSLGRLAPGELRRVRAELQAGGRLLVEVLRADGRPADGAEVSLLSYVADGTTDLGPPTWSVRTALRDRAFRTTAGMDGRCVFEHLQPGRYSLAATLQAARAGREPLLVRHGSRLRERLELPAVGALSGHLRSACSTAFEELYLRALPGEGPLPAWRLEGHDPDARGARVEADGGYRFDDLPAGPVSVYLLLAGRTTSGEGADRFTAAAASASSRFLATARVEAYAETTLELRVDAPCPVAIELEATVDGRPAEGCTALAERVDAGGRRHHATAVFDASGRARLAPLEPDEWRVCVLCRGATGHHLVSPGLRLSAGETAAKRLDIATAAGRLLVVSERTGAPARSRRFELDGHGALETDAEGRLALTLCVGEHELRDAAPTPAGAAPPPARFEWPASGEGERVVRVALAEELD